MNTGVLLFQLIYGMNPVNLDPHTGSVFAIVLTVNFDVC